MYLPRQQQAVIGSKLQLNSYYPTSSTLANSTLNYITFRNVEIYIYIYIYSKLKDILKENNEYI
jgi:hypothetical protein